MKFFVDSVLKNNIENKLALSNIVNNKTGFQASTLCLDKRFKRDSIIYAIFNDDEMKFVCNHIHQDSSFVIDSFNFLGGIRIVNDQNKYNDSIYHVSQPIFTKNFKYCFFGFAQPYPSDFRIIGYSNIYHAILFIKVDNKWKFFKELGTHSDEY